MADEDVRDYDVEARKIGWKPKEEFRGDPAKFTDAETFVKRGEEFLPIIKASNRNLQETVESQNARLLELERINKANAMALEELQTSNREQTVQTAQRTIEDIAEQIAAAREAGNVQEELALLREHAEVTTTLEKAKQKPAPRQQPSNGIGNGTQDMTKTPAFQQFLTDNPWWNDDPVMRAASIEIQNGLYREGKISDGTPQADRLEAVAEATRKRFGIKDNGRRGAPSRVEGGGGPGAGGSGSSGGGKSYSDLPEEAKAACSKAAKRLKIGKGLRYETIEAWQNSYAKTYFSA